MAEAVLNGTVGVLAVNGLRNVVFQAQNAGYACELRLGSGWLIKPFHIRGDAYAVRVIAQAVAEMGETKVNGL